VVHPRAHREADFPCLPGTVRTWDGRSRAGQLIVERNL
jgi:hypothetical protein